MWKYDTKSIHIKWTHIHTLQQEECGCLGTAAWRSIRPSFLLVQPATISPPFFLSPSIYSFPPHLEHRQKHTHSGRNRRCHHHATIAHWHLLSWKPNTVRSSLHHWQKLAVCGKRTENTFFFLCMLQYKQCMSAWVWFFPLPSALWHISTSPNESPNVATLSFAGL